jgi:hypothetical protein
VQLRHYFSKLLSLPDILTSRPPLWSSGQSSWQQIHRYGFYYGRYQILSKVLEWGPLSLMSTTEELLEKKIAAPV